jgi:hypothetical protein
MKELIAEEGLSFEDITGQPYDETRTDCEASIIGQPSGLLMVAEVVKPLIRQRTGRSSRILQAAVVLVTGPGGL